MHLSGIWDILHSASMNIERIEDEFNIHASWMQYISYTTKEIQYYYYYTYKFKHDDDAHTAAMCW